MASLFFSERSYASTGSLPPDWSFFITPRTLSSGMVKTTVIGCNWVMTTSPLTSDARTILPGSTWRSPSRPLTGAVMRL